VDRKRSSQKQLAVDEYKQWSKTEENGLYKEKQIEDVLCQVQLVPCEISSKDTCTQMADFNVTLKSATPDKNLRLDLTNQFGGAVKRYFAFEVEHDIYLQVGDQKLKPQLCIFEQGTDLSKDFRLVLAFDYEIKEDITLVIDSKYPNTGIMKFKFKQENLQNKPQLAL